MILNPFNLNTDKEKLVLSGIKDYVALKLKLGVYDIKTFIEDISKLGIQVTKDTEQKWEEWFAKLENTTEVRDIEKEPSITILKPTEQKLVNTNYDAFENKPTEDKNFKSYSIKPSKIKNILIHKMILMKRKILIGFGLITLMLTITNPTHSDFKNYLNAKNISNSGAGRTRYFLVFSIYENNSPYISGDVHYIDERSVGKYIGIFKNFIILSEKTTKTEEW